MSSEAQKQANGHPKIQVKRKNLSRKKPLPLPAVALSKHRAISFELRSSETSWWSPQNSSERKINLSRKKPLPVPAVALSKPRAISCELTCSQSSWWSSQNSHEKKKINNENTTAGTGSGFEQAQGHQLWAYMLTIKLMVSSRLSWENQILQGKNHCRYRQWLWASPRPSVLSLHAHNQADGQLKTHVRTK
jgi:hypothetical protein